MLDPDPDPINPDQQHWFYEKMYGSSKAVNREDKRSRRYRDRDFAKFERSRGYRDR